MTLSTTHRDYLLNHAIRPETLRIHAVRSEGDEIIFPWRDGDLTTEQRRPWPGEGGVYFWETGKDLHFWTLRDMGPNSPVLLVEGTKQSLAADSYAPAEYSVMGMAGCWGWSKAKLSRFKGRDVLLCLDADAGSNLDVYEAGEKLGERLKRYRASLRYLHIPASGSQGLDDYLASLDEDERTEALAYEIEHASPKVAERRPTARKRKMESDLPDTGDRTPVAINLDRKMVIDKVVSALKDKHDGVDLFNYGEVLTRVKGHETQPLDRDRFYALLANAVACFRYTEATDKRPAIFEPAWPDPPSIGAVMSKAEEFSLLRRVVRVPFLRPDGTVCTTPGYDRETATVLVPSGLGELTVPSAPSKEQTVMAAKLLMEDWLGDFPFESEADRANALAMVLTPFVRGSVPLVPLAVVNGLEAGVGKNLLADCAAILATGEAARPLPYVNNEEEMRKQITAAFAGGAELFIFDEAHVVEGTQFARAVTSLTYTDRVLGVSRMASFPNQVTWMSLGNQVQVNGDMSRRVYFVCLSPAGTTLADRESYAYRHPDLKAWTLEHRTELVSAALTVLTGWVAAGRPGYSRGASMGSFEPWDRLLSGVLAHAGFPEFLTDSRKRRSESDFSAAYWEAHVAWLYAEFGAEEFTTRQVQEKALRNPAGYEAPPGMEDVSGKDFTRKLGQGYSKHRNRTYNGLRLVKAGMGHRSTLKWQIDPGREGDGGKGGNPTSSTVWGKGPLEDSCEEGTRVREGAGAIPPNPPVPSEVAASGACTSCGDPACTGCDWTRGDCTGCGGFGCIECIEPEVPDPLQELTDLGQEFEALGAGTPEDRPPHLFKEPIALGFDIETASADELFTGKHDGPFVRLCGSTASDSGWINRNPRALVEVLNRADVIYGHNILGFDLLALAHHHGADYDALAAKAVDTRVLAYLIEPPAAKAANVGYDLDSVAQRLGHGGKTDDLKGLAKRYGGFDKIPVDSREYQEYLRGDLAATKEVYRQLRMLRMSEDEASPVEARIQYAEREMRVAALQNRMTLNGWAVDTALLAERVAEEEVARLGAIKELHERYGVPLAAPDRFKLRPKAEWPEDYRDILPVALAREGLKDDPERSVEAGLAVRIPGKVHTKPWVTDAGKDALVKAFAAAGARHVPRSPKSDSLLTSADALGEGTWYCTERRKAVKGMLHPEAYGSNDAVRAIVDVLLRATGVRDKYNQMAKLVTPQGRIHGPVGAPQGSGRWSMTPFTTMGKRTPQALRERDITVADPGHMLITCDHSQLDVRTVAALSQDPELIGMLQPDSEDYHTAMSKVYFGTPDRRNEAKPINHGVNYGQGAHAIAERNGLDEQMVADALRARGDRFQALMAWTEQVRGQAAAGMLLDNGFGRLMRATPERAFTQAPALMGQGASRDVMCESLLRLAKARPDVTPFLRGVIHDEIVLSVPADTVDEWAEELRAAMTWEWRGVPILCDVSTPAFRWSDCK